MNLSSFAFESEVSESAMLKVSTDSMRDLGTDVKMPSLRLTSAGTGVTGPAGKWSRRAGRRRAAVYLRVQAPKSFWTGSSSSGPARPRLELHVVIHLSIPSEDNPVESVVTCIYYKWECDRRCSVDGQKCHRWMNARAVMSSGNHLFVRGWSSSAPITISVELIKVSLKWL